MQAIGLPRSGARLRASVAVLFFFFAELLSAAPYKPASPDEVLLEVDPAQRQARASLRALDRRNDLDGALQTARKFLELGRAQHDERFFGYASATLQPWRNDANAPIAVLLLRADIAQYQHQFDDALRILDRALARDPNAVNAYLMRATIRLTQGQPQIARRDCQKLFAFRETFAATVCLAEAASLNGQLASSYRLMLHLIERTSIDPHDAGSSRQYAWAFSVAAEMAERLGERAGAETYLRRALTLAPNDFVSRLQLCDLLLELKRPGEALQLIESLSPSDPILLRRALAARQVATPKEAQAALAAWKAAVERSTQLGVTLHLRELARGQFELLHAPALAVKTALANWQVQREPIDARLLADTARAAGDPAALKTVREWRQTLQFEDAELRL